MYTKVFFALMLSNASLRVATLMLVTLVPLYALDIGLSPLEVGLTTTLYFGAAALARPLSGWLVDTRGRWPIMFIGVILLTLASGMYLLTIPAALFLTLRAVQGVGFSLNSTASNALASDMIPRERLAEGLGILGLEQTVVQIFAPWLALILIASYDYETAFAVVVGCCVANLLLRIPLAKTAKALETTRRQQPKPAQTQRKFWTKIVEPDAWRPASVMFFFMMGNTCVGTFLAASALSREISNVGLFFVASGVALAISRLLIGPLQRHLSLLKVVALGIALSGVSMLCMYLATGTWGLILAGVLYGLGVGVVTPSMNAITVLAARSQARGRASATLFLAMDTGMALGAWALGYVAVVQNMHTTFLWAAGSMAIALFWLVWLARTGRLRTRRI